MIQDLLDPNFLQAQKKVIGAGMEREAARLDAASPSALEMSERHLIGSQELREAGAMLLRTNVEFTDRDQLAFIPRDPFLSILQASLDESYADAGAVESVKPSGFAAGGRRFVPGGELRLRPEFAATAAVEGFVAFQEGDPRYASMYLAAKGYRLYHKKLAFETQMPTVNINNRARVVLFGDWGSGIPRAQDLSKAVQNLLAAAPDREGHAIHLGDVYYAGFESEYRKRVLPYWPGAEDRSWSISGNHDMYTGGAGFFRVLLTDPRLARQKKASWFLLENEHWQIFGLDSSWAAPGPAALAGDLHSEEAATLWRIRDANRQKGGVVLTHHQPFSGYGDTDSPKMVDKLAPALDQGLVRAWFWGHEHRCAVYKPWRNVVYPCLTGNAGIPVPWSNSPMPSSVRWQWNDMKEVDGEKFATMGCVVLDFTDDKLEVTFYNEDGRPVVPPDAPHIISKR